LPDGNEIATFTFLTSLVSKKEEEEEEEEDSISSLLSVE